MPPKESLLRIAIALAVFGLLALLMGVGFRPLEELENRMLDLRFRWRGPLVPPEEVVIAAIDEESIARLGRWPWDRDRLAELVRALNRSGADLIVFDIILSEAERHDAALAEAMDEAGNVLLPIVFAFDGEDDRELPPEVADGAYRSVRNQEAWREFPPITAGKVLVPVPELAAAAMGFGHINMFPERDGILRWEVLAIAHQGKLFPSLPLQAATMRLGIPPDDLILEATRGISVGQRFLPTDVWGRTLIPWYGPGRTFPHFPIAAILAGEVPPEQLAGKIVLVGASAVGIYDLRVTPFAAAMPGVEKHASIIASILEGRSIRRIALPLRLTVLLAIGLALALLLSRLRAVGGGVVTATSLALLVAAAHFAFVRQGIWLDLAYPAGGILASFLGITVYNYATEERKARRIKGMFSSYVTERIVNELIRDPQMARLGGSRREVTVLFSDIRGFTTLSERLTPEEVVSQLNEYLGAMTDVIFRWEGTLDKFIGDAIVVFWGAPMPQENHAELATRCALEMSARVKTLQAKWAAAGRAVLEIGIGVNTGEVLVGNIGAEGRKMDYTVIGDHVNLGARVEGLTRTYGAEILITGFTLEKIRDRIAGGALGPIRVSGLDRVVVKGKEKPVDIYEVRETEDSTPVVIPCEERAVVHFKEK